MCSAIFSVTSSPPIGTIAYPGYCLHLPGRCRISRPRYLPGPGCNLIRAGCPPSWRQWVPRSDYVFLIPPSQSRKQTITTTRGGKVAITSMVTWVPTCPIRLPMGWPPDNSWSHFAPEIFVTISFFSGSGNQLLLSPLHRFHSACTSSRPISPIQTLLLNRAES